MPHIQAPPLGDKKAPTLRVFFPWLVHSFEKPGGQKKDRTVVVTPYGYIWPTSCFCSPAAESRVAKHTSPRRTLKTVKHSLLCQWVQGESVPKKDPMFLRGPVLYPSPPHDWLLLLSHFSRVRLCATPSLGFSRLEHWSELPFPSPMHKSEKWKWSRSVTSDSPRPHGPQPTRLLCPWDFPGKSTGVRCHCLWLHVSKLFVVYDWILQQVGARRTNN